MGTEGSGLYRAVLLVYSICSPTVLALQHSIHICTTLAHLGLLPGLGLGLVEAVVLAIHRLPNRQMQLADVIEALKQMLLGHLNPLLPLDSEM